MLPRYDDSRCLWEDKANGSSPRPPGWRHCGDVSGLDGRLQFLHVSSPFLMLSSLGTAAWLSIFIVVFFLFHKSYEFVKPLVADSFFIASGRLFHGLTARTVKKFLRTSSYALSHSSIISCLVSPASPMYACESRVLSQGGEPRYGKSTYLKV